MLDSQSNSDEKVIVKVDAEIEDIIPIFFETLVEEMETALDALQRDDYETTQIWGHSLRGTGGGYGFEAISEIGKSLEQAAKPHDSQEVRNLVDQLSSYLERVHPISLTFIKVPPITKSLPVVLGRLPGNDLATSASERAPGR